MGQRLIVSIEKGGKELCNIYYHWGAYTDSALLHTKEIVDCIYNHKDETDAEMLLRLIHFCENQGGGIANGKNGEDWSYICNLYPDETFKADNINRSDGLISLSESGMAESHKWSEGDVIIDLDTELINFGVYSSYENFDDFLDCFDDDGDLEYDSLYDFPEIGYDLGTIKVTDIDKVIEAINNVCDYCRHGNEIIELT